MEKTQKIWFLQVARFLACALIVYIHWYGIITLPNTIHRLFLQDAIPNYPTLELNDYVSILINGKLGLASFSGAYFALGLFFILSGYVIPLSLKNSTPYSYLVRRLFRIYPSLIVCGVIAATVMTLVAYYLSSSEIKNLFKILLPNILLVRDLVHTRFIDNATWTLEIEMHFYLLIFAFFYFSIEKKLRFYLLSAVALLFLGNIFLYLNETWHVPKLLISLGRLMSSNSNYLTFMFAGTTLYYTFSKQWSPIKGIVGVILFLTINKFCLLTGNEDKNLALFIFVNHLYAFTAFVILYCINDYLPYSKVINKLAEISYPFYLLHGFTGYSLYFLFYHFSQNILIAAISALACVFLLAFLVHYHVELPGIEASKDVVKGRMGRSWLGDFFLKRKFFAQRYSVD